MCLAIPMKIVKLDDNKAEVQNEKHSHNVDVSLIDNPQIGDYILIHGDMGINRVPENEAKKIANMIQKLEA